VLKTMRRSKQLSKKNGWSILISLILVSIPIYTIYLPIMFNFYPMYNPSASFFTFSILQIIVGYICMIPLYSVLFYGYQESKVLTSKE